MNLTTRLSAAFQGELGAFSFSAAQKLLGTEVICQPLETFTQVFEAIHGGIVDFAVIPIENTLYGSVHENYDHLLKYDVEIRGETTLRIEHALIVKPHCNLQDIRRAFSHPVALEQCRRFFKEHPAIAPVPYYDTAGSVKMLMRENQTDAAAIASERAADIYGAQILLKGIEDNQGNFTRFFLLTKQDRTPSNFPGMEAPWKTSLVFATANIPGALSEALRCFSSRNLNLTKLESRPVRETPWEYLFHVDIVGSASDAPISDALRDLKEITSFLKVLGSYCPTP